MPRIIVHIEELVLSGFAPSERYRIQDALQSALIESLASGALRLPDSMQSREIETIAPQRVAMGSRNNTAQVGTQVAKVLVSGIGDALVQPRGGAA